MSSRRPPPTVNVRRGDERRAYLESHVFELLIAALGVLAALGFFLQPGELRHTAIGRAVHPFDYGWNMLYLTGGLLIVGGLVRRSFRLELAGLAMFGAALIAAAIALISYRGVNGVASLAIYSAAGAACFVRMSVIRRVEQAFAELDHELELLQPVRRRTDKRK